MLIEDAHALVIGISRYRQVAKLRETQDAQDIAAALRDPGCCGYPPAAVRLLIDDDADRVAILAALDALAHTTRATSTVFIYYSGHGGTRPVAGAADGSRAYYLIPVDALRDDLEHTAISSAELTARLRTIPAARLTLVLDCCRAADLAEADLADPDLVDSQLSETVAPLAGGRGRAVLAASRAMDVAYSMPGQRNSMMTTHLIDGLRGAASGVGGVIRICDLFHYVQQHVAAEPLAQHPVFKAELEENYPIAQLRGGVPEALVIPAPPSDVVYDAFVSYCDDDADDREWVTAVVVPYLEDLGLKLCLEHRDFRLGAERIEEIENAVVHSRYTVAILTPAYLASAFDEYELLLAKYLATESRLPRLIPLVRKRCQLKLHTLMTEALDVSQDAEVPAALQRLAVALRQPPRPRLDA